MKKKITCFSIFGGSVLFILIFMYQVFFRVFPPSMSNNMNRLRVPGAIFLALYWLGVFLYFVICKKTYRVIAYVVIPMLSGLLTLILIDMYYAKLILHRMHTFPYIYLFFGWICVSIFAWLVERLVLDIARRKSAQSGTAWHPTSAIKKKSVCFSIFCTSVLFILLFMCKPFFSLDPPSVMDITILRTEGSIFLALYWLSLAFYFIFFKKIHNAVIYVAIPLLSRLLSFAFIDIYYRTYFMRDMSVFFYLYFMVWFFSAGLFAWPIDLLVSYIARKQSAHPEPPC